MSIRSNRLGDILEGLGVVEGVVDQYADRVYSVIGTVREKVEAQYDQAIANDAYETEAERRAQATAETVVNLVKNVAGPQVKNFFDVFVNPAADPGSADEQPFNWGAATDAPAKPSAPAEAEVSLEDKIEFVREWYRTKYGMQDVWTSPENLEEKFVNDTYTYLKNL